MNDYPSIADLAKAPLDRIIKSWEGLGYYSRARNLHEGAQYIVRRHRGNLPPSKKDLEKIKGLGPYTIGAILSFAFHQKSPAVDGNTARVLSRYFMLSDDLSQGKTIGKFQKIAYSILPDDSPWVVNEALIELGAMICQRKPKCEICPISSSCKARLNKKEENFPYKSKRTRYQSIFRFATVILHENETLLRRVPRGEIMSDLHEFPYYEHGEGMEQNKLIETAREKFTLDLEFSNALPKIFHTFTSFRVHLHPLLFLCSKKDPSFPFFWVNISRLNQLAFSSGHRRIAASLIRSAYEKENLQNLIAS